MAILRVKVKMPNQMTVLSLAINDDKLLTYRTFANASEYPSAALTELGCYTVYTHADDH